MREVLLQCNTVVCDTRGRSTAVLVAIPGSTSNLVVMHGMRGIAGKYSCYGNHCKTGSNGIRGISGICICSSPGSYGLSALYLL